MERRNWQYAIDLPFAVDRLRRAEDLRVRRRSEILIGCKQ
jgi:hypothetical protein